MEEGEPLLWDAKEVAKQTGLSLERLKQLRREGGGPIFLKIGKSVHYRRTDVAAWMLENRGEDSMEIHRVFNDNAPSAVPVPANPVYLKFSIAQAGGMLNAELTPEGDLYIFEGDGDPSNGDGVCIKNGSLDDFLLVLGKLADISASIRA